MFNRIGCGTIFACIILFFILQSCFHSVTTDNSRRIGNVIKVEQTNTLLFPTLEAAQQYQPKHDELKMQGGEKGARAASDFYYATRSKGSIQKDTYVKIISIHNPWLEIETVPHPGLDPNKLSAPFLSKHGYVNTNDLAK